MGITGIAVNKNAAPLQSNMVNSMLSAAHISQSEVPQCGTAPHAQIGAASSTGTTSFWCSPELMVVCDASLVDIASDLPENAETACISAAEIIGRLYLRYGTAALSKLRGSFALAIWNKHLETMLLAVDRFAIKPLTYHANDSQLIFASQARSIFS